MITVTLEAITAKQAELTAMIAQLHATMPTTIELDSIEIELAIGERYAGAVLDENGDIRHHLVMLADRPAAKLDWQAAMAWADSVGGHLPTRQEQALLFANCKPHLKPEWHWSGETYADDASYAWRCHFTSGTQSYDHKSYEGSAVAVRRLTA